MTGSGGEVTEWGAAGLKCDTIYKTRVNPTAPCRKPSRAAPGLKAGSELPTLGVIGTAPPGTELPLPRRLAGRGLSLQHLEIEIFCSCCCKYFCPFLQPAFSTIVSDADWCLKREGRSVREAQFLEQVTNSQKGQHAAILPFNYVEIYIHVGRYLCLFSSRAGRLGGPPSAPVPRVLLLENHRAASSSHSACLAFFSEWWKNSFSHSSISFPCRVTPLSSSRKVQRKFPPVFSHTDPDVARGVGNSVLRFHHEKHWWIKNRKQPYTAGRWMNVKEKKKLN